jgi:hypothetical protein
MKNSVRIRTGFLLKPFYLALIVGFSLKVYFLFAVRFHVDELIHSWIHYVFHDVKGIIDHVTGDDVQMPLFFVLCKFIFPAKHSFAWLLRLPWFFLVLLSLIFFFQGMVKNYSARSARFTLVLLMLSAPQLIISTSYRPYALFLSCALLFYHHLFFWLEGCRTSKRIWLLFFYLILMSLTHYFGILFSLMFMFYFSKTIFTDKRYYPAIVIWTLCLYPFVDNLISDFGDYYDYRDPLTFRIVYNYFSYYSFGLIGILSACFLFFFHRQKSSNGLFLLLKEEKYLFFIYMVLGTFLIAVVKSLFSSPVFEARYFLHLAPLYYLIISELFIKAEMKLPGWSKYLLILWMAVFSYNQIRIAANGMEPETYKRYEEARKIYGKHKDSYFILKDFRGCPLALFRQNIDGEHLFCGQFFSRDQYQSILRGNRGSRFYQVEPEKISEMTGLPTVFPENRE